jgi:transcriptional regulator with XRE-family HTH domain
MELGLAAGVSTKHVSFVETGRASPSREMVLHLADHLDVPMRDRNALLLAAGYAPRFAETPLDAEAMASVRRALEMVLEHHEPVPAVVVDRRWDVVTANRAASLLTEGVETGMLTPPINVLRISLHPAGLAPRVVNFDEYAAHLVGRLRRQVAQSGDPDLEQLFSEVATYPGVTRSVLASEEPGVVLPLIIDVGDARLSLFSTIATFGTPLDITTAELAIEAFFPADESTDQFLRHGAKRRQVPQVN